MKKKNSVWALMALCAALLTACDSDSNNNVPNGGEEESVEKYIVAASGAEAIYLLETDDIEAGSLTTEGAPVEVETATAWLFPKNKYAYHLVYAQGNAGTGSSYKLDESGHLVEREIAFSITDRFTTYGIYKDLIICAASGATDQFDAADADKSYPKYGVTFTYLDTEEQTKHTKTIVTEDFLGNGERYTVSGIVESDGKFFTALCSEGFSPYGVWKNHDAIVEMLTAAGEDVDATVTKTEAGLYSSIGSTMYPNEVAVAIYEGTSFENPTILTDDRLSTATSRYRSQYYSNIAVADNGDVYVFSANHAGAREGIFQSDRPSGALRIKSGAASFDKDYFCDITTLSDGRSLFKVWHISGNYFLLQMFAEPGFYTSGMNQNTNRLAILKADTKEFAWVSGMPDDDAISSLGSSPYFEEGKAYMPVVFRKADGEEVADDPAVYMIDATTATATKGLSIKADNGVSAIGKLHN
ncbi:DUF4374 domain-containing protein [Parabacteroides sp. OttesenSCG-928-J18]|nr:DUF4374 domain-containing protein [Parabacteroides sp. OttesenSCG-928-J18]